MPYVLEGKTYEDADVTPLYKGVSQSRLKNDIKEYPIQGLPTGVRFGSATVVSGNVRKFTALDKVALFLGDRDTAESYCNMLNEEAILLEINTHGIAVFKSGFSYFTTIPISWDRISYLNTHGQFSTLVQPHQIGLPPVLPTDFRNMKTD